MSGSHRDYIKDNEIEQLDFIIERQKEFRDALAADSNARYRWVTIIINGEQMKYKQYEPTPELAE